MTFYSIWYAFETEMMRNILEVLIDASLQNWNCDIDGSDGLDLLHAAFLRCHFPQLIGHTCKV